MCFILHMASKSPAPIVPWNEAARGFWTAPAKASDVPLLRSKFTLEHIIYVGSRDQCGCGFRNAMFQQGNWPEEWYYEGRPNDCSDKLEDHAALVAFLEKNLTSDGVVELFGVWESGLSQKIEHRSSIPVDQLADPKFHFRDRGIYTVELSKQRLAA